MNELSDNIENASVEKQNSLENIDLFIGITTWLAIILTGLAHIIFYKTYLPQPLNLKRAVEITRLDAILCHRMLCVLYF